jgi:mono/diheme cytochrome c family protein
MDPTRDNPVIRFTTFWWAIGTFLIFALLLAVIWLFARSEPETMEDAAAKPRYDHKAKIDAAQATALPDAAIEAAIPAVAKNLVASKAAAVEVPGQIVPGSPTAKKLAEAPAADTSAIDAASSSNEPIDPAQMEAGKAAYLICAACHGQEGEGTPAGPPLAGSEWVTGPVSNLILIQMRGLTGPITVAGKEYTFPAGMFPLGLPDKDIADVLTYIRNSFGNKASAVKVEQVTPLRGEIGKPQLTQADLIKP